MQIVSPRSLSLLVALAATASLASQESKAYLHAPMAVLPVQSAPFQKLGDFDGDGDLDAVGTRISTNGVYTRLEIWRNDGGTFVPQDEFTYLPGTGTSQTNSRSAAVAVADLNGDGYDDIIMAANGTVERWYGGANFGLTRQTWWLPNASAGRRAITTGDFDADGTVDVAVAAAGYVANGERIFVFFGAGNWTELAVPTLANGFPRLDAMELDGVPGDDLLLSGRMQSEARVYSVAGQVVQHVQTLTSTLTQSLPTPWLWMGGDVDNDGDEDVVVFRPSGVPGQDSRYEIFRRVNGNSLVADPIAFGGPAEYLADIDGDGDLDGVCCGGGGTVYTYPVLDFASTFELSTNRGGGDFAPSWNFPGAGSESMAGVADIDGDGDVDLVAGRCVFYGDGPWDSHPMPLAGGAGASLALRPDDLHDCDRDGDVDFGSRLNRGDGVFADGMVEPQPPAGHVYVGEAIPCDVDGDGARDRVCRLHTTAGNAFVEMVWLRNNGGGFLTYEGAVAPAGVLVGGPSGGGIDDYFVADFDGDGDEDIFAQDTEELFYNDLGSFSVAPVSLPVEGVVEGVADFNGDNLPDILLNGPLVYFGIPRFGQYVLEATGNPASPFVNVWEWPSQYPTIPYPHEPGATPIADLDGDGRLDFIRLDGSNRLWLFFDQAGPGQSPDFQGYQHQVSSAYVEPSGPDGRPTLTVGDVNGDGLNDIVMGRQGDEPNIGVVMLKLPVGMLNYEAHRFALPDGYLVDMDFDGDLDLVGERAVRNRQFGRDAGTRIQKYEGVAGEAGATPVLGGEGSYEANSWHTLHLSGVTGPTSAILGISLFEVALPDNPLPGMTLRIDPGSAIIGQWPITENSFGRAAARSSVPLPIFAGMQGWEFHLQVFVPDAAAPQGFSQSNLLSIRVDS